MRILCGVVGEGMGHATRSRVLLEELVKEHQVHIVVSGRAWQYLEKRLSNVHNIWGLSIAYQGNQVKKWQTVVQNLKGAISGWPKNIRKYFELAKRFRPEVVLSDFESFSYLFGKIHSLPIISIDNMQIINRCSHEPSLLSGYEGPFELARSVVQAKLPGCFHYLVSSFFYPPLLKERTTLVPSILRPEILAAKPEAGEHLLVYQTATTNRKLVEILGKSQLPCRIYGMRRDLREDCEEGNLLYRPFDERAFVEDLRTARGVVAGGGFTLMSEAVYLRKPMLSTPVVGQFEQVLNALYLQKLGYGVLAPELSSEALDSFLGNLSKCYRALQSYHQDGNEKSFAAVREKLARAAEVR